MSDSSSHPTSARSDLLIAEARGDLAPLRGAVNSSDATHRVLALGALDRLDQLDDDMLIRSLADVDAIVRIRALEIAVPRPSIDLVPSLSDHDDLVVETTAWALGERESATDAVVDALCKVAKGHEVSICREASIAALGAIGSERGLDAILGGLSDRATVRRRAVLALAPFDGPRVRDALNAALGDRDRQVRQAAEDLL